MSESCATCRFLFQQTAPNSLELVSFCRRNPPSVLLAGASVASSYAPVQQSNWCGEYQQQLVLTPGMTN